MSYTAGNHNVKVGGTISATQLDEHFTIGFTDPDFNAPFAGADGTYNPDAGAVRS